VISQVVGELTAKEIDRVEILTSGGSGYEILVPLSVFEMAGRIGDRVALHTHLVVKEDGWQLFGFATIHERRVFQKLLSAKGVGPALALGMLSTLSADRVVQALRSRDIATLQQVPRVGRKKAEQMVLDLADKLDDLGSGLGGVGGTRPEGEGAEAGVRALVSLGYSQVDAERAVAAALDAGARGQPASELIRRALAQVTGGR
jgi:Holliday junction DNA helicase RuvA